MKITPLLKGSLCLLFAGVIASPFLALRSNSRRSVCRSPILATRFSWNCARRGGPGEVIQPGGQNDVALEWRRRLNNQTNQIDNLISAGVDMIILGAADSKGIAPAVKRAKEAGIVVIAVDVSAEGGVDATVMSDNKQAGQQAGQYIVDKLKGKGQMVIVNGPAISSVQYRVAGALEVLKKYPDIKILSEDQNAGGSRDGGLRVMTDLLTAFPKLDAVLRSTIRPASAAISQRSKRNERISSSWELTDLLTARRAQSKGSLFEATPAQDPYTMAKKAVEVGYGVMNGKKPEQETILIPIKLITREM